MLSRCTLDLQIESANHKAVALVFFKIHAVTEQVKDLVSKRVGAEVPVISEGTITAEQIGKDMLFDTHYGAIAAKTRSRSLRT